MVCCFFVLFSPLGRAPVSTSAIAACVLVVAWAIFYGKKFFIGCNKSVIILFFGLAAWFIVKAIFSLDVPESFGHLRTSFYKGFVFFGVGLIVSKNKKMMTLLPYVFFALAFTQGIDGVFQYFSGKSLFLGKELKAGRLTASFGSYNIGNYVVLCLVPALAMRWKMPKVLAGWQAWALTALMLAPTVFLIIFGSARIAYLCFFTAMAGLYVLHKGFSLKLFLLVAALGGSVLFFSSGRLSWEGVMNDGRIRELWPFAIEVIKEYPITGAGLGMYNNAFTSLGLVPQMHEDGVPHPHNFYLQLLCETGIVGFLLYVSFAFSTLSSGWTAIRLNFKSGKDRYYWIIVSLIWSSCLGFLAMAVFGHNIFKDWWLAISMLMFGLVAGACSGINSEKAS